MRRDLLYDIADYCVAVPHDRFWQARLLDRDSYRYRHYFGRVSWSGIELSALVRKRLAILRDIDDAKGPSQEERLAAVMKRGYSELPDVVAFQFGSAHYRLPLFIYALRHTFWRPRDVLFIYAALLAATEQLKEKRTEMPPGFVRQVVAGATRSIVEHEFINEYKNTLLNMRDILAVFRQAPQVLSWPELHDRLAAIRFEVAVPSSEAATVEAKVDVLYELGVLGAVLDRRTAERFSAFRHAFAFNEGDLLPRQLGPEMYSSFQFAIHPVLVEFLHLDTTGNAELILPMDWSYLHHNEIMRRTMQS